MKPCLLTASALIAVAAVTTSAQAASIVSFTPSDDSTGVSVTPAFTIFLDEVSTVNDAFNSMSIFKSDDNSFVANPGTFDGFLGETDTYNFFLSSGSLDVNTSYYVNVADGAFSGSSGNSSGISGSTTWNFTTVPEPSSLALIALGGLLITRRPRR